jgi:hypothetical protein
MLKDIKKQPVEDRAANKIAFLSFNSVNAILWKRTSTYYLAICRCKNLILQREK